MPKTVLFTFENEAFRDKFLSQIRAFATEAASPSLANNDFILDALDGIKLDPPVKSELERTAALFVSGKKLAEGSLSEINKRFDQEASSHSASIEVREMRGGEWKVIRSRRTQR